MFHHLFYDPIRIDATKLLRYLSAGGIWIVNKNVNFVNKNLKLCLIAKVSSPGSANTCVDLYYSHLYL
jgi:hypothetical protein